MRKAWLTLRMRVRSWRDEVDEHIGVGVSLRALASVVALYLLSATALGVYWSREPQLFSVQQIVAESLVKPAVKPAPGSATVASLIHVTATLLNKPGGFLGNDIAPPGVWLDNMPAWEGGAIVQARDLARALRDVFSRAQPEAAEDADLGRVEPRLNFSANSWVLPSSESEYRDALSYLRAYLQRLQNPGDAAKLYPNADNLSRWLTVVESRLGSLSQRLSACVKPSDNPSALTAAPTLPLTPWNKIDDVFYEARGSAWALIHFLRAIDSDFAEVLQQKQAQQNLREIIRDLEATQEPIYSPVILNGGGFSMLANHSLVMASYIARANAATITLRERLNTSE